PGAVRAGAHRRRQARGTAEAGKPCHPEQLDLGTTVHRPAGAAAGLRIGPRMAAGPQTPATAAVLDLVESQGVPEGSSPDRLAGPLQLPGRPTPWCLLDLPRRPVPRRSSRRLSAVIQ